MHRLYGNPRIGACLGSILEVEPGQMPRFEGVKPEDLPRAIAEYVAPLGLTYIEMQWRGGCPTPEEWEPMTRAGFWIFRGPSAREPGTEDALVMVGAKIVHDPSGADAHDLTQVFDGTDEKGVWAFGLLVPFNPRFVRRHARPGVKG